MQDKALNQADITNLQTQAAKYGGVGSDQFKNVVNTKYGAGAYDQLMKNTALGIQSGQVQGNTQKAEQYLKDTPPPLASVNPTEQIKDLGPQKITDITGGTGTMPGGMGNPNETQPKLPETTKTVVTQNQTPTGTITTTETPKETPIGEKILTIDQFKAKGANPANLEQFIEDRYGTTATQQDGGVVANINGENFKWTIDASGNPIKQSLGKVGVEELKQTQLDPNNLFNQIRSGQVLTKDIQNTDEYKKQKQRADNLARFENMSAKDLSYAINNGSLLPGTQTYNDLKALNPNLVRDAENLNALNSALTTTEKSNTDVLTKITEQIFKIFNGDTTTLKTKLSQNPEVVKLNQDMATKKNELNSLKDSINNAYRDIEKELSGSGATKGYIQALASRRTEDLTRDYNTKLNEYNTMAGQLQTITEMVGDELEQEEKLQEKKLKALEFAYGIAKDETNYQRSLQAEQRQAEQQAKQAAQSFENQKELLALQQKYKDADIQTSIITDEATGKKSLINNQTGETIKTFNTGLAPTKTGQNYELKEFGGKTYRFNQTTGEYEVLGGGTIDKQTAISKYGTTPAVRNFNPGNIMDTGFGGQKVKGERFTVFNSPQEGFNALVAKIENIQAGNSKVYSPDMTLLQYISKYAPASDNNNPTAYANAMAKDLGVTANTKIGDIDAVKLASAHAKHEDRNSYKMLQDLGIINADGTSGTGQDFTENDINKFKYSEKLTPNEQNNYLKEQGLVDKYLKYNANRQETEGGLLEGISSIQDISLPEKTTEFKSKSYNYGIRMDESNNIIESMGKVYSERTLPGQYAQGILPNPLKSSDQQKLEQAERNFINAILRQESGAVISDTEFKNYAKQYFPQPGDSKDVLTQKKQNRETSIQNMLKGAGKDEQGRDIGNIWKELNKTASTVDTTGTSIQYGGKFYNFNPEG